jgi:hypothetical protein
MRSSSERRSEAAPKVASTTSGAIIGTIRLSLTGWVVMPANSNAQVSTSGTMMCVLRSRWRQEYRAQNTSGQSGHAYQAPFLGSQPRSASAGRAVLRIIQSL